MIINRHSLHARFGRRRTHVRLFTIYHRFGHGFRVWIAMRCDASARSFVARGKRMKNKKSEAKNTARNYHFTLSSLTRSLVFRARWPSIPFHPNAVLGGDKYDSTRTTATGTLICVTPEGQLPCAVLYASRGARSRHDYTTQQAGTKAASAFF